MDDKCIINPERDCIGKVEAAKLEGRIKALEEWKEASKKFHTDFYQWQNKQAERDGKLNEQPSFPVKHIMFTGIAINRQG